LVYNSGKCGIRQNNDNATACLFSEQPGLPPHLWADPIIQKNVRKGDPTPAFPWKNPVIDCAVALNTTQNALLVIDNLT
jgi:hypothetical protein